MNCYRPPKPTWWIGRFDGPGAERYHETVKCIDITKNCPINKGYALVGFACDEGIRRNQGRTGASQGPEAFRNEFGNLPVFLSPDATFYDVGDICCGDGNLESAQQSLAEVITKLREKNILSIVIGGGHELAWGQFQGLNQPGLTIVNFDAHYDIRPLLGENQGTSGTSFKQIANFLGNKFDYTCIGIQRFGNTKLMNQDAKSLGIKTVFAGEDPTSTIEQIIKKNSPIYLSVCLDVFASSAAPGVSAPQPLGLDPWQFLPSFIKLIQSQLVIGMCIAELSPPYDRDNRTARLAANIVATALASFT